MNTDLILFLYKQNREFLRHACKAAECTLTDDEQIVINGSRPVTVSLAGISEDVLQKIYRRLLSAITKSGANLVVPEKNEEFNNLVLDIRDEMEKQSLNSNIAYMISGLSFISNEAADKIINSFANLTEDLRRSISDKTKPNDGLGFSNYIKLKELLEEKVPLSGFEFYSGKTRTTYKKWEDAVIKHYNETRKTEGLSVGAVLLLFRDEIITNEEAANYFINTKEEFDWKDIKDIISSLLKDRTKFTTITTLLDSYSESSKWLVRLLDVFVGEDLSGYILSLPDSIINLESLPCRTVSSLFNMGRIDLDSVIRFYLDKINGSSGHRWCEPLKWEDIRNVVLVMLQDSDRFDDLYKLVSNCSDGLHHLYEETDLNSTINYSRYLSQKNININTLPLSVVRRFYQIGIIDDKAMFLYYSANTCRLEWNTIKTTIDTCITDRSQFDNIYALVNRDSSKLRDIFGSFDLTVLQPFIDYLLGRGYTLLDIYEKMPNNSRESLFLSKIESGNYNEHRQPLEVYFQHFGNQVSLDMFAKLFDQDYYFRFILSAFRNRLDCENQINIKEMNCRAKETKAWEYAQDIIARFIH